MSSCRDGDEDIPSSASRRLEDQLVHINGSSALVRERNCMLPHLQDRGSPQGLLDLRLRGFRTPGRHFLPVYRDLVVAIVRPVTAIQPDTSAIELEGSGGALGGGRV